MSPLGAILLRAIRAMCLAAAVFVALVMSYELWARTRPAGFAGLARQDLVFWAILALMLLGFVWMVRSITRELAKR